MSAVCSVKRWRRCSVAKAPAQALKRQQLLVKLALKLKLRRRREARFGVVQALYGQQLLLELALKLKLLTTAGQS